MSHEIPEVRFDMENARPVFPRPNLKHAVYITIPHTDTQDELPTFITPEWGGVQVFYGDYYGIVQDGKVIYGSAREQWEQMHTVVAPGYWVKTSIPTAYRATEKCRIVTLIPTDDGSIREANYVLNIGDWILRQPGGEVQHVKAEKFEGIYFSDIEIAELGLLRMTGEEFAQWATAQVRDLVPTA